MKPRATTGQSLAEYVLIAGFLLLSSLAALTFFSTQLGNKTEDTWTAFTSSPAEAHIHTLPDTSDDPELGVNVSLGGGRAPMQGSYASTEELFSSLTTIVETTGGSGVTKEMFGYMEQLIAKNLAEGEINEDEANRLLELSSLGYQLSDTQAFVEQQLNSATSLNDLQNKPLSFAGKTYKNLGDMSSATLGAGAQYDTYQDITEYYDEVEGLKLAGDSLLWHFIAKHKELDDAGVLSGLPTELAHLVTTVSGVTTQMSNEIDDTILLGTSVEGVQQSAKESNTANVTAANAKIIETAGGG